MEVKTLDKYKSTFRYYEIDCVKFLSDYNGHLKQEILETLDTNEGQNNEDISGTWISSELGFIWTLTNEDDCHLVVHNSDYLGTKDRMIEILWDDYAKHELYLTDDEIEEDLHRRARQLMQRIDCVKGWNTSLSLDDYYAEKFNELNTDELDAIQYLLKQFCTL